MLNAGVLGVPLSYTKDNFELQVGTNQFGHFVLVQSLLDKLQQQVRDNGLSLWEKCAARPAPAFVDDLLQDDACCYTLPVLLTQGKQACLHLPANSYACDC